MFSRFQKSIIPVLSLKENESDLNLFANPANDEINVTGFEEAKTVTIYNVLGKTFEKKYYPRIYQYFRFDSINLLNP